MMRLLPVLLLAAVARAQLVCDAPHHDFGRQPQHVDLEGSFEVRNAGTSPVFIQSVTIRCFCAKGKPEKKTLEPGESTRIDFTFKTGGFEGAVKKPVLVRYGTAPTRTLELSIGGVVVPSWKVDAATVNFGGVTPGQRVERDVLVDVSEGFDVDVTVGRSSRLLDVERFVVEERRRFRFRMTLKIPTSARPGPFEASVTLKSDDDKKPSATVSLRAHVESDLRVAPRFLALGSITPDAETRRSLVLESASKTPFKLLEIREHRFLLVEGETGVSSARHELVVVAPKGLPAGAQRGSLVIRTDRKDEPVVRIPFSLRVRSR